MGVQEAERHHVEWLTVVLLEKGTSIVRDQAHGGIRVGLLWVQHFSEFQDRPVDIDRRGGLRTISERGLHVVSGPRPDHQNAPGLATDHVRNVIHDPGALRDLSGLGIGDAREPFRGEVVDVLVEVVIHLEQHVAPRLADQIDAIVGTEERSIDRGPGDEEDSSEAERVDKAGRQVKERQARHEEPYRGTRSKRRNSHDRQDA